MAIFSLNEQRALFAKAMVERPYEREEATLNRWRAERQRLLAIEHFAPSKADKEGIRVLIEAVDRKAKELEEKMETERKSAEAHKRLYDQKLEDTEKWGAVRRSLVEGAMHIRPEELPNIGKMAGMAGFITSKPDADGSYVAHKFVAGGKETTTYHHTKKEDVMNSKILYEVFVIDRQGANTDPVSAVSGLYVVADNPESARTIALLDRELKIADLGQYHVHAREICQVPLLPKQLTGPTASETKSA